MSESPQIYGLLARVMGEVGAVGKTRRNEQQRYMFRGIDDVLVAVQLVMANHGVICVPRVVERERENVVTKSGGSMASVRLLVEHTFYAPDGSSVTCTTLGEAMDSGDKASNKAMSAALKYALVETLLIPTEEPDRDIEERAPERVADRPIDSRTFVETATKAYPVAEMSNSPRMAPPATRAPVVPAGEISHSEVCALLDDATTGKEVAEIISKHCPAAVDDKEHPVRVYGKGVIAKLKAKVAA